MQGHASAGARAGADALASLRRREDSARRRLGAVRERLAEYVRLARQLDETGTRRDRGAYRNDARDLDAKLRTGREARDERARLRVEEADLMTELESIRASLERRGIRHLSLPMLENVAVASPCDASWADMKGDSDTRFCTQCQKDVHNLSMMSRAEAEAVVAARALGRDVCIRLYRRTDGTVLTDDCPVGVRRRRFWRRTAGVAAAGLLLAALGSVAYSQLTCSVHVESGHAVQGF